jgi:hypothetical protein
MRWATLGGIMDPLRASVEQILLESQHDILRVLFRDGDTYDLTAFGVAHDDNESLPHATATVVRPVRQAAPKARFFPKGSSMFFSVDDVCVIQDANTGVVLFDVDK